MKLDLIERALNFPCSVDGQFWPELALDEMFDLRLYGKDVAQGPELLGVLAAGVEVVGGVFELVHGDGVTVGPLVWRASSLLVRW